MLLSHRRHERNEKFDNKTFRADSNRCYVTTVTILRRWVDSTKALHSGLSSCDLPELAAMLSRRKCPLDKYFSPKLSAILLDIVPFPDPGGPIIAALKNLAMSL